MRLLNLENVHLPRNQLYEVREWRIFIKKNGPTQNFFEKLVLLNFLGITKMRKRKRGMRKFFCGNGN